MDPERRKSKLTLAVRTLTAPKSLDTDALNICKIHLEMLALFEKWGATAVKRQKDIDPSLLWTSSVCCRMGEIKKQ